VLGLGLNEDGRTNTFVPDVFDFFTLNEARNRNSDCPEARQYKLKRRPTEFKYNLASAHQPSYDYKVVGGWG
jgi:hypothetical protein